MPNGNCGQGNMAVVFLVTYLVISFLVIINMYIAVILENFSQVNYETGDAIATALFDNCSMLFGLLIAARRYGGYT